MTLSIMAPYQPISEQFSLSSFVFAFRTVVRNLQAAVPHDWLNMCKHYVLSHLNYNKHNNRAVTSEWEGDRYLGQNVNLKSN